MLTICNDDRVYVVTFPNVTMNTNGKSLVGDQTIKAKENQLFFRAKSEPSWLICSFNSWSAIPKYFDLFRYDENLIESGAKLDGNYLYNKVFPYVREKIASTVGFKENNIWWNEFLFAKGNKAYIMNNDGIKPVLGYTSDMIFKDALIAVMNACPNYSIEDKVKEFIKIQERYTPYNFYPFCITDTFTGDIKFVDEE